MQVCPYCPYDSSDSLTDTSRIKILIHHVKMLISDLHPGRWPSWWPGWLCICQSPGGCCSGRCPCPRWSSRRWPRSPGPRCPSSRSRWGSRWCPPPPRTPSSPGHIMMTMIMMMIVMTDLTADGLCPVTGSPHDGGHTLDNQLTLCAGLGLVTRHTPVSAEKIWLEGKENIVQHLHVICID